MTPRSVGCDQAERVTALCLVFFSALRLQRRANMCPFFEDDEDPKRPRPVFVEKKREGALERGESRKDNDRDDHRHVHIRA